MSTELYPLCLIFQVLTFAATGLVVAARGRESAFSPMCLYLLFHCVVFVVRPWLEWSMALNGVWAYMGYYASADEKVGALLLSSVCLVAIAFGYLRGVVGAPRVGVFPNLSTQPREAMALLAVWVLAAPIALYSMWITRHGVGLADQASVAMEIVDGVIVSAGGNGYANDAQNVVIGLAAISLATKRYRGIALVMLSLYFARKLLTGGGRWGIVLPMASFCLLYMHRRRLNWPPAWTLLALVPLAVLFTSLGEDRYAISKMLDGRAHELTTRDRMPVRDRLDGLDFANFEYLVFVKSTVPERTGTHSFGVQYLQLATEPIPRSLWPGKPAGPPVKLFDLNDYGNFFGLTVALPGDLWITGGWIAIVVGGAAVGFLFGWWYREFRRGQRSTYFQIGFLVTLPLLIQFFRDGGIVSFAKFVLFVAGPIALVKLVAKSRLLPTPNNSGLSRA